MTEQKVKIIKATKGMWYENMLGMQYVVVREENDTRNSFWVVSREDRNVWLYKGDCEIITEEATRPFNLEHAKSGAPYACRNGDKVEIFKWNANNTYELFGTRTTSSYEYAEAWKEDGSFYQSMENEKDLVMIPLTYLEGKPVFVGDELETSRLSLWHKFIVHPRAIFHPNSTLYRWPVPERVFPKTSLTDEELQKIGNVEDYLGTTTLGAIKKAVRAVANGAIKQYISDTEKGILPL